MTDVISTDKDVIVEVKQPTVPSYAPPTRIGLVEINQVVQRGTAWMTGQGPPTAAGGQYGDMYLDADTGDMYQWNGSSWTYIGTFAPATDTPQEVLDKLLTVDGAGSTLDADLLDGQHGAFYAKQTDMTAVQNVNAAQTTQINQNVSDISTNQIAIQNLQTSDTTQNSRLTAVENKNTAQDASIALLAPIANPTFTGDPKAPTASPGDNDTSIATTAFVTAAVSASNVGGPWAPIASPTFTGDPKAPTPALSDNDTSLANTAWVTSKLAALPPSGVPEAPNDGVQYVRQSLNWAPVIVPPGTYVADSPPASPSPNQLWWKSNLGQLFIYYLDPGGAPAQWVQAAGSATGQVRNTARTRNRIRNPSMQISQENGTTAVGQGAYPADQWNFRTAIATGAAADTFISTRSPDGAAYAVQMYVSTAKPSLAAGDYQVLVHPLEGLDIMDLLWGTAAAKPIVIRFNAQADVAGTYGFSIRNGATNDRSYLGSFTLTTAGVWQTFSFAVPGDTTGTWTKDQSYGWSLTFNFASGTTFIGAASGWQTGNFHAPPGCINGAAQAAKALFITDVGLYADPDGTGLPPPWNAPSYDEDLARCLRYYETGAQFLQGPTPGFIGVLTTFAVKKRTTPSSTFSNVVYSSSSTLSAPGNMVHGIQYNLQLTGGGGNVNFNWATSARLL